ncbi:Glycoside hydrolase [Modestobacter italicus]|uniref:Glycoside hydrolase n=1 Tax=Modestobacter italicus (strain DSM 44449 / CECT 9708 / BC 501) TaxID=2732864 RepID=I4EXS4_MODI5|nr:Glycoside hydrolase [Modestobacter marinus]
MTRPVPFLRATDGGAQLVVDGEPTLLLGGQLHNSAASDPEHLRRVVDHVADLHAGTVIGSAGWAQVEPVEGTFDFSTVDAQLAAARDRGLHLVLIWFGAFKNAASTYAPRWVRADSRRFPRAVVDPGMHQVFSYPGAMPKPVLSVFSPELLAADRAAFVALVRHLAEADPEHVVVMVQVENEIGLLGDSRDRSPAADEAWAQQVPAELLTHLAGHADSLRPELAELWQRNGRRTAGTWAEVFGAGWEAEEVFMAWAFARHVEELAAAGKAVTPLPMYVNAWLGPQPGQSRAGEYPSGGPTSRVLDVWKAAAPSLDLLAPDVYVDDAQAAMADYDRPDNPLFIPETRFRTGSLFWALGHHRALGFSVFGIEDGRTGSQLARAYALLRPLAPAIAAAQAEGRIEGILLDEETPESTFRLGGLEVTARGSWELLGRMLLDAGVQPPPPPPPPPSETEGAEGPPAPADTRPFGLLLAEGEDTFLLVGQGVSVDFSTPGETVEVDQVQELRFDAGRWYDGRLLNGDERLHVIPLGDLGAARITLLRTPLGGRP